MPLRIALRNVNVVTSSSDAAVAQPRFAGRGLAWRCAVLLGVALLAASLAGAFQSRHYGQVAWLPVLAAGATCFLGCGASLVLACYFAGTRHALPALMGGLLVRLVPPFAALLALGAFWPAFSVAGGRGALPPLFCVMLFTEVALEAALLRRQAAPSVQRSLPVAPAATAGACSGVARPASAEVR